MSASGLLIKEKDTPLPAPVRANSNRAVNHVDKKMLPQEKLPKTEDSVVSLATVHALPRRECFTFFSGNSTYLSPMLCSLCLFSTLRGDDKDIGAERSPERDPGDNAEDTTFQSLEKCVNICGSLKRQIIHKWKKPSS